MAELVALNPDAHGKLKLSADSHVIYAQTQHMLPLYVTDVAQAILDCPVFFSRLQGRGDLSLSALTSFTPGTNLFVRDDVWDAGFRPSQMQTYPFFLKKPEDGGEEPELGVDADSPAFGHDGEAVFDTKGKPSIRVNQIKARLMDAINAQMQTLAFLKAVDELKLISPVDIVLNYPGEAPQRIQGLHLINEETLQSLGSDELTRLRDRGYLAPIYAILLSTMQLNALIRRHNAGNSDNTISNIKLEVAKSDRLS